MKTKCLPTMTWTTWTASFFCGCIQISKSPSFVHYEKKPTYQKPKIKIEREFTSIKRIISS